MELQQLHEKSYQIFDRIVSENLEAAPAYSLNQVRMLFLVLAQEGQSP